MIAPGWVAVPVLDEEHRRRLTIRTKDSDDYVGAGSVVRLWLEDGANRVRIPRGYARKHFPDHYGAHIDSLVRGHREQAPVARARPLVQPRQYQDKPIQDLVDAVREPGGGCKFIAPCGSGKTVMGLLAAAELGGRTLITVHSEFLLEQWLDRIEQVLGIPRDEVGIVQGKKLKRMDAPIAVAMIQTLIGNRVWPEGFARNWQTIIPDEGHRAGAPKWGFLSSVLDPLRWILLTANERRGDGLEEIIRWTVGGIGARCDVEMAPVTVREFKTGVRFDSFRFRNTDMKLDKPKMNLWLSRIERRTQMVVDIVKAIAAKGERRILVLSDYLDHIRKISEGAKVPGSVYFCGKHPVTGKKMKARELVTSVEDARVIFATYAMAREAMDVASLDTEVLALPVMGVKQVSGRIRRYHPEKRESVLVDLVDDSEGTDELVGVRRKGYERLGFDVKGWG